jgi:hypothetical protein
VIIAGLAFMQNLRRGRYELATETSPQTESLRRSLSSPKRSDIGFGTARSCPSIKECNSASGHQA